MRGRYFVAGAIVGFLVGCLFTVWAQDAEAHSFFSTWCCSGQDCALAPAGSVTWTPEGYFIQQTGEVVPLDDHRIQYSPPGNPGFYTCILPTRPKNVRCLYVPEPEG